MKTSSPAQSAAPLHLLLSAAGDLAPFDDGPGRAAVLTVLRRLASEAELVILAFAIRPSEVELLLAPTEPGDWSQKIRTAITRAVNRALQRKGSLLRDEAVVNLLDQDQDWVALADAIESGVDGDPGDSPASSAFPQYAGWVRQNPSEAVRRKPAAATETAPAATIGDVIEVANVPTVVQLAAVRELAAGLREGRDAELLADLQAYVGRWFLSDRRTLAVVRTLLASLAHSDRGGGFFVSGLYGAGKSHLLAALALAAEFPAARRELFAAHEPLADLGSAWPGHEPLLVVAVALDEMSPNQSLEEVVFGEAQQALTFQLGVPAPLAEPVWVVAQTREHLLDAHRRNLDAAAGGDWSALANDDPSAAAVAAQCVIQQLELPFRFAQSRVERLGRLQELAAGAGCRGVLLLLDELSVFLGSRVREGLQADAGFLQFLGQRTALSPLWVVAALQKQIEDVGPIEHYTLRQVKDRFETRLALPLTAAREVLRGKVLPRRSETLAEQAVAASVQTWAAGQRLPDLSAAALRDTYPLHPLTVAALESCAERFLAKTRSVIEFAAQRVAGDELAPGILGRPLTGLLCCDELWDQFARDLVQHPDLRRYHELFVGYYEHNLRAILEPGQDAELALRLVKLLAILRLAGLDRGVRDLAAALLPYSDAARRQIAELLETLRTKGPYLTVERQRGSAGDVYRVDLEFNVNQTIRRRVQSLAATLAVGDARLTTVAVKACQRPEFPLASALHERIVKVAWRHTERAGFLTMQDLGRLTSRELANQAAALAGPELAETLYVWLAEPQRTAEQAEAFETALAGVADPRWRHALVAWVPREATSDERQVWVEDVAHELLRGDPTLTAGGLGEALLARLDEDGEARLGRLAGLLSLLYREGTLVGAAGRQPVGGTTWHANLASLGDAALPPLYPLFSDVAPRRGIENAVANLLIERLVLPGEVIASPSSVLARDLETVAVPLGVAVGEAGRYELTAGGPLARPAMDLLPERDVPVATVERLWAKSELGLDPEQSRLLLATLIRRGHLVGVRDDGQPAALGVPLRSVVAAVRPAPLVDDEAWSAVAVFHRAWLARELPERDRAGQQAVWDRLVAWRPAALTQCAAIDEAIATTAAACRHEPLQWREASSHREQVGELAGAVDPSLPAAAGLIAFAAVAGSWTQEAVAGLMDRHRTLRQFTERRAGPLRAAWHGLQAVTLPAGEPLAERREALLRRFAAGEAIAFEADALLEECDSWRREYTKSYAAWHAAQHAAARFEPYDACRAGWRMRVLGNLSRLALDAPATVAVGDAILAERRKQCRRADLTLVLRDGLVCPDCGLLLGEPVRLRAVAELDSEAEAAIAGRLRLLQSPAHAEEFERGLAELPDDDARVTAARALLAWQGAPDEAMLPITSFAVIDLLNLLLTSPVVGHRSLGALTARLAERRLTRRDIIREVERWVDPEKRLVDDDLLQIDP